MDLETVERLLHIRGWPCERIADDTIRTYLSANERTFPVFFRIGRSGFLAVAIVTFVRSPAKAEGAKPLYERLLRLNHQLMMAKFSIDDDLDVVLSAEYPLRDLDPSELNDAIDVLAFYAREHHEELLALAQ